ncbi:hypothetical protein ACMT4L_20330 [Deinococcus sp. A31D244]|uniref:hypothetical protein n=1 Tax=Deinococcus sp. A31D244 TaxID=3397675 RepID=UPI0039DFCF21
MTLLRRSVLLSLLLTLAPGAARAQAPANCALANAVDSGTYSNLTIGAWSEVDQDNASYNWAECRAAALRRTLTGNPKLSARIDTLRRQYREMRAIESELAGTRAGGGTLYAHAVPRSFAFLEEQIGSLAALARSPLGGQTGALYARQITQARADHAAYIAALRRYRPGPDEDYVQFDPTEWKARVDRYEALGKAIMLTLGSRSDAATATGYAVLTSAVFSADGDY